MLDERGRSCEGSDVDGPRANQGVYPALDSESASDRGPQQSEVQSRRRALSEGDPAVGISSVWAEEDLDAVAEFVTLDGDGGGAPGFAAAVNPPIPTKMDTPPSSSSPTALPGASAKQAKANTAPKAQPPKKKDKARKGKPSTGRRKAGGHATGYVPPEPHWDDYDEERVPPPHSVLPSSSTEGSVVECYKRGREKMSCCCACRKAFAEDELFECTPPPTPLSTGTSSTSMCGSGSGRKSCPVIVLPATPIYDTIMEVNQWAALYDLL